MSQTHDFDVHFMLTLVDVRLMCHVTIVICQHVSQRRAEWVSKAHAPTIRLCHVISVRLTYAVISLVLDDRDDKPVIKENGIMRDYISDINILVVGGVSGTETKGGI